MYDQDDLTKEQALAKLEDIRGDQYLLPGKGEELLYPFHGHITDEFRETSEVGDYPRLIFRYEIADTQTLAKDEPGHPTVPAYQPVLTGVDISNILVEALGGEPSDYHAGGTGFTHRGRHEENVEWLTEHAPVEGGDE